MTFEQHFESLIGLGFTETLIVIGVILILIDIFFPTDITTHIAYVIFAYLVYWNLELHFFYRILWAIVAWFILVFAHYTVWRVIVKRFTDAFISPDKYKMMHTSLIGKNGIYRRIDNTDMISINGELLPCRIVVEAEDFDQVIICDYDDGLYIIEHLTNEKN